MGKIGDKARELEARLPRSVKRARIRVAGGLGSLGEDNGVKGRAWVGRRIRGALSGVKRVKPSLRRR